MKQLERLFAFWPHPRVEADTTRAYVEVMAQAHSDDVLSAVGSFVFGKLDRNHAFLPAPGELSAQITKARNARLDEEARNRPRLPPPIHSGNLTAEQRKAIVADLRAAGKIKTPGKERGPTDAEHQAAFRATIAEAMKLDRDDFDAMVAALPDRPSITTERNAA